MEKSYLANDNVKYNDFTNQNQSIFENANNKIQLNKIYKIVQDFIKQVNQNKKLCELAKKPDCLNNANNFIDLKLNYFETVLKLWILQKYIDTLDAQKILKISKLISNYRSFFEEISRWNRLSSKEVKQIFLKISIFEADLNFIIFWDKSKFQI